MREQINLAFQDYSMLHAGAYVAGRLNKSVLEERGTRKDSGRLDRSLMHAGYFFIKTIPIEKSWRPETPDRMRCGRSFAATGPSTAKFVSLLLS